MGRYPYLCVSENSNCGLFYAYYIGYMYKKNSLKKKSL